MPELPEVETVRLGLEKVTVGMQIMGGEVLYPRTIAHPQSPQVFIQGLQDATFLSWMRRGKYLLSQLSFSTQQPSGWLGVHLRMTGQLLWVAQDEPVQKHTRVRLFFVNNRELRFVDQRTFGQMWWVAPTEDPKQVISGLQKLGPEPFSEEFSVDYFWESLQGRKRSIKSALLDQALVAGVGNIYADEALFMSEIRPTTACHQLQTEQVQRLRTAIIEVLSTSIGAGGTTFSDFRDLKGVNGNYGGMAWVYGRQGQPCRTCGQTIERIKLVGRSTHFCPQCQPES
ncbi:DNA-formamidopyrimidine glycosylase [Acaryochloris marina]|uniref:Formamidopyrimidine-DNA glycosylase n=1 Tax=Acaryochloris marina (strain MBIC 11017) TaxID=329726 RepID=FPG_ACAM1|nr:DNA-formamidopyrimidine glycosylase [Acaryochloris marina]B0C5D4.1 RecName: Full=Formamidopyrimidine-DNA glycosylase; Short=Fapy-DNA glycosylase; AltName: Full=DNA-(apurinic or apyrimidinic site) lyase MutM; Short=AP lyase MutM [Acaryochloris marina MBIC11017]ABW27510.1 formamidopyrimidine-DNA glycosylase [Acaryochloris marina MBIC11017]